MASSVARRIVVQAFGRISRTHKHIQIQQTQKKSFHVTAIPFQKYYSEKHEWLDVADGESTGVVGITEYAQNMLGEVVYVQVPDVGTQVEYDCEAGVLESVKAASDIFSPASGEITEVNSSLTDNPSLVNSSPEKDGWLYKMNLSNTEELKSLMNEKGYKEYVKSLE